MDSWEADFLRVWDSSGQALALAPVVGELDRILMVTHAATEKLTEEEVFKKGIKQVFRICYFHIPGRQCSSVRGKGPAGYDRATINPKYEYGYTTWKMFQDTLGKLKPGVKFVADSWAPFGTTDFRSHINTILDAKPEGSIQWFGPASSLP